MGSRWGGVVHFSDDSQVAKLTIRAFSASQLPCGGIGRRLDLGSLANTLFKQQADRGVRRHAIRFLFLVVAVRAAGVSRLRIESLSKCVDPTGTRRRAWLRLRLGCGASFSGRMF